jgi:hypothetical protein
MEWSGVEFATDGQSVSRPVSLGVGPPFGAHAQNLLVL